MISYLAGDKPEELFEILHAALQTESPEAELLRQAVQLQWPILAILAACQPEASAPRCMAAWLQATMRSEGKHRLAGSLCVFLAAVQEGLTCLQALDKAQDLVCASRASCTGL